VRFGETVFWVGTNKGPAKPANDWFTVMTTRDGLFSDAVSSVPNSSGGSPWSEASAA
jgi:hypothetical protein